MAKGRSALVPLRICGGLAVVFAALVLQGCGKPRGNVSGKVYYKDKALPSGIVTFVAGKKAVGTGGAIQEDGSYSVKNVPAGDVTITVAPGGFAQPKSGNKRVDIPQEYSDPTKSKLKYTVTAGDQEYDIKIP